MRILYPLRNRPWGGGNQFLIALNKFFTEFTDHSTDNVYLVNSHQISISIPLLKAILLPHKRLIHRIDGPLSSVRDSNNIFTDLAIYIFSLFVADGVIFQSSWSKRQHTRLPFGSLVPRHACTIVNGVDCDIFNSKLRTSHFSSNVIKIVCSSWSPSLKKGSYKFCQLASNFCGTNTQFTFIGNLHPSCDQSSIIHIPPLTSANLSLELQKHDLFVSFSQDDPCSNALLESVACGCCPLVLSSGGNAEIIELTGGYIFTSPDDICSFLHEFIDNPVNIPLIPRYINIVGREYNLFISQVLSAKRSNFLLLRLLFLCLFLILVKSCTLIAQAYAFFSVLKAHFPRLWQKIFFNL
ncbi:glycosyl transferases group 1 family protein [Synechococcus sp. MIT S9220]|uniref:hypothetical protein n=1 Tax=unclassified Synechococcus TaxID=2626047 RepID=UPI00164CC777|nr:hypothetical protein [Synechococcus sp. MIT S9220]NOL48017.1 glycosyltransferase family 4 protein [Synechococcus sp. MIT S9220]QNJ21545.1 glycosyl transferases group 1 family protein [Synechococcus sp. MIT S9220]